MIRSKPALDCAAFTLCVLAFSSAGRGQSSSPGDNPERPSLVHGETLGLPEAAPLSPVPGTNSTPWNVAGAECLVPPCLYCHFGVECNPQWLDDDECDCGCRFADNFDCGSICSCDPSVCVWCWCNTTAENACLAGWNDDGECDCACQFTDVDCPAIGTTGACCNANGTCTVTSATGCSGTDGAYQGDNTTCDQIDCRARCEPICDYCWDGTPRDGACPAAWEGDGVDCDCGCQFADPDCGPEGACCFGFNGGCGLMTETTCRFYDPWGVFQGVDVGCGQVNCDRCDPGCEWCWMDTIREHACDSTWADDLECDCGCQFADPDCASGVCGNLVCEESATACHDDCKDLRAFAGFQNCFGLGQATPQACAAHLYAAPDGVGLEDYALFDDFLSGP